MSNKMFNWFTSLINKTIIIIGDSMNIRIGVSNRHVHLKREDLDILFGKDYKLTVRNKLNQPTMFAAEETVTLKTPKNIKEHVRIVGPVRNYTQVELLEEDKEYFGINPPYRDSGDLDNSETITIIGPKGEITKENICIIANRHIHINIRDKKNNKYKHGQIVSVLVGNKQIDNVHIKKADNYKLEFHINKDDAIKNNIEGERYCIIKED